MGSRVVNGHFDHALVPRCPRLVVPGQSGARCSPARSALAAPAGPACPTAAEGELAVAGWRALGLRCGPALHQASASPCASRCEGQKHARTVILARAKGSLAPREDQCLGHRLRSLGSSLDGAVAVPRRRGQFAATLSSSCRRADGGPADGGLGCPNYTPKMRTRCTRLNGGFSFFARRVNGLGERAADLRCSADYSGGASSAAAARARGALTLRPTRRRTTSRMISS